MTREERAIACITEHRGAEYANPKMVRAMLTFADAEAAAMRERALPDRDAMIETVKGLLNQHPMVDAAQFVKDGIRARWIVDAIRALPATGEVGRG